MNTSESYCTFRLGEAEYALEVSAIQEVLRDVACSAVPLAPASLLGLMNLRGELVTVIDLARQLGIGALAKRSDGVQAWVSLVLCGPRPPLCFAVDEVGEVQSIERDSLLAPPANLGPRARACVRGVHLCEGRVITVLETSALLEGLLQETTA